MDAINKFVGFRPSILPEPQEKPTEQISQVSTYGNTNISDAFETLPQNSLDFEPVMTPMNIASDEIGTPGAQTETIEASSVFDFISAGVPATIDSKVFDGTGGIRWDCIEEIKDAMGRGDIPKVLQTLREICPNELGPTLTQMAKQGMPSDLQLMIDQICQKADFTMVDPWLMTMLERCSTDSTVKLPLQQMMSRISGKPDADTLVRGIFERTRGQNILGKLDQSILSPMYNALQRPDTKIVNALCAKAIFDETGIEPEHCPGAEVSFENPDSLFQRELDKGLPTQDVSDLDEAMRLFPEWGVSAMKQASEKGQLSKLMLYALVKQDTSVPLLAAACKETDSKSFLTEVFREVKKYGNTDQDIRGMVQYLGSTALQVLSRFPPLVLMDIKTILEDGTEKELNQAMIQNVIQPALNAAKFGEKLTQTAQDDMIFPKIF